MKKRLLPLSLLALAASTAAHAAPIPRPVEDMIRAAASDGPSELSATVKLAKRTNPGSSEEIDALVARLKTEAEDRHRAELEGRSFFAGWDGQGEAGVSKSTGNTESASVALGLNFSRSGLQWDHNFTATVDYQDERGVESKSRYFASYSAHYKFAEQFYALGVVSWERDKFSGFSSRASEALGLGYAILRRPDMTLSVEGGPALRQTAYVAGGPESNVAARAAVNYHWDILSNLTLAETASFYEESHDSTIVSETGLTVALIDALSARLSFHMQYESNPPLALENTDTMTRLTLVYSF